MSSPCVLIVSTIADTATDDVVRKLSSRGIPHSRINTEDFPFSRTLTYRPQIKAGESCFVCDGRDLSTPTSVWYRRMRTPPKPDGMDEETYSFCLQESRAALLGSLMGLSGRWMSHPAAVWQAEFKPYQLRLAAQLGFAIPSTIITNDPVTIRDAFTKFKGLVAKATRNGWTTRDGQTFAIFTSQVLEEHLDDIESAKLSPAIYQALIPKKFDVRVTIVGRRVFAAAIESQSDPEAVIDWRMTANPKLPHRQIDLPQRVADSLLDLMDSLRLSFAAIDLIKTPDDQYVFLEVNPSGQWLWLDEMLEFGISEAVAEWLAQS
jgi:glutathione synthase/RimK-type ligase-like ATP-grasp enzyme